MCVKFRYVNICEFSEFDFPVDKSVALVITLLPWSWFESWAEERVKKRGEEYNGLKMAIGRQMWQQLQNLYPQLAGRVTAGFDICLRPDGHIHSIMCPRLAGYNIITTTMNGSTCYI